MLKHISALVTGGASGLGRATVERLANSGARVAILDLPTSKGKEVASRLGGNVIFTPGDVTSESDVQECLGAIEKKFAAINTIINCAGIGLSRRVVDLKKSEPHALNEFRKVLQVNTLGMFNVLRLGGKPLVSNEADEDGQRGIVINTASIAAYEGQIGQVAYAASQGAITSMTIPLARDFGSVGVRVVTIAPGAFDTPFLKDTNEKLKELMAVGSFPHRLGNPDEFAHLVEHVILNKMLNGCVIRLDAGLRLHT